MIKQNHCRPSQSKKNWSPRWKKSKIIKLWTKKEMITVLQIFKPSGTPGHFPTQRPGGVPILNLLECQARNLLSFLVVAQVITLVAVYQLICVWIPVLCQVLYQPHWLQVFQVRDQCCYLWNWYFFNRSLRCYFTTEYPFVHTHVLSEKIRTRHLHAISISIKRTKKKPLSYHPSKDY